MALYFTYVVLGLSIALPVGTVTIEMTKQGLTAFRKKSPILKECEGANNTNE